jgi:hypothetical protein
LSLYAAKCCWQSVGLSTNSASVAITRRAASLALGGVVFVADLWFFVDEAHAGIAERVLVTAVSVRIALVGVWLLQATPSQARRYQSRQVAVKSDWYSS